MPDLPLLAGLLGEVGRGAVPRKGEGRVLADEGVGVVFAHCGRWWLCVRAWVCEGDTQVYITIYV